MKKILLLLSFLVAFNTLFATEIFYVSTSGNDSNDGKSWATAYASVQKAIDAAANAATDGNPAQVWIAEGTYYNAGGNYNYNYNWDTEENTAFVMKPNVEIYGGFAGTETKLEERTSGNETILTTTGSYVIYNRYTSLNRLTSSSKLDGVTITGACYGIYNYYASPTITNCTITGNGDRGIDNYSSSPTITNCTITGNGGSGIVNNSSSSTITNCTITENYYGIENVHDSSPTITNCIIWGNSSNEIYNSGSNSPTVRYCVVRGGYSKGTNIITSDPKLGVLGNYSGNVQTIPVLFGSSAIGAGTPNSAPTTDARGIVRANPPTIGAFEASNTTSTGAYIVVKKNLQVGKDAQITIYSDGNPSAYILYRDDEEIERQTTNMFTITPTEAGIYKYSAGVIYNGNEFKSASQITVRHISGDTKVIYVSQNGSNENLGDSWQNALLNVQEAIDVAATVATTNASAQVWIAKGSYYNSGGFYIRSPQTNTAFVMKPNVEIYGGFAGTETKLEERTSGNETILTTTGSYVIYNRYTSLNRLTSSSKLDGVTITGAYYGIYNYYASPMITNCTITGNYYGIDNNYSSSPTITNCTITGNGYIGIGNYYNSNSTIVNCTITENTAGMDNYESTSTITNCTVTKNVNYGIIDRYSSNSTITNCIIWGNEIERSDNSSPTVTYCVVEGGYSGTGNISADPLLGELGDYGGNVQTIPIPTGSSAIGAGTSSGAPTSDARGVTRANPPTIGAFEISKTNPTFVDISINKTVQVGKETQVTVYSDGTPSSYILYRDGEEIARQSTNVFAITPTESGFYKYSVGIIYNGNEIKSESQTTVRHIKGNIIYVSQNGSDENLGDSWQNALLGIQTAIDVASEVATDNNPAQVWIAKGTYYNAGGTYNSSTNKNTAFVMKPDVEIYGGFAGTETKLEERTSGNETILTTTGDCVIYNRYTSLNRLTSSSKLDGVTITGASGYGIYNYYYASPTITNCTITENGSSGIDNSYSSPTITNCTITENGSSGIDNSSYSSPTIVNCTITENYYGIDNDSYSSPTIVNCTITGNNTNGIRNASASSPMITNCIIWGNKVEEIYNYDYYQDYYYEPCSPIVTYCVVEGGYSSGTGNISTDPKLGVLGNYSGNVQTIPVLFGSSAIGAGTSSGAPTTDARGIARANPPTIGAFEASTTKPTAVDFVINKVVQVRKETQITVYSDGAPSTYILYKDGEEIARQTTNVFTITPTEVGFYKYSAGVIYNGNEFKSASQITVRHISGDTKVIYVSQNGSDENLGDSWQNAFVNVQKAINAAANVATDGNPAQVWIAKGTYYNAGGNYNNSDTAFKMKPNVEIYGGFAGTETKLEERTSGNETILTTTGDYVIYNKYTEESQLTSSSKLDGVTITGASFNGIYNYYASPTITNCTIAENGNYGIYNSSSSPTITNCTITGNGGDGIINSSSSSPTITNCTITGNGGDGIINSSSFSPTITNCTITGNRGDGIINSSSFSPTITNCIIWGNSINEIYNESSSSPTVRYCVVRGGYSKGTNIITSDPKLGVLGNYSGNVQTIPVLFGSSAIGAGTPNSAPTTDARGIVRANPPTIGAFEKFDISIDEQPEDMPGFTGKSVSTSVKTSQSGIVFQWQISIDNGSSWANVDEYYEVVSDSQNGTSSLTIPSLTSSHNGALFRCCLNEIISETSTLTIRESASITTQPEPNTEVYSGKNTELSVSASGYNVTYQWFKNGVAIDGATSATLNLNNVSLADNNASYYCVVSNGGATVKSNTAILTVRESVSIATQPNSIEIFSGHNAHFSIEANGYPTLKYQWYKNGEKIDDATSSALSLSNVPYSDNNSTYHCVVTNAGSSTTSKTATLTVHKNASITTQPEPNTEVYSGKNTELSVSASGYNVTYQWFKNGVAIDGQTSATLSFEDIDMSDTASYYCVVSNGGATVQSEMAALTVRQSASDGTITKNLPQQIFTVKDTTYARLIVETTAYEPTFKWYYLDTDNNRIPIDSDLDTRDNVLQIPAEMTFYNKRIFCEISNAGGSTNSNECVVRFNPNSVVITSQPENQSCKLGETAMFSVTVTTNTGAQYYQWQRSLDNGETWQNIDSANESSFSVKLNSYSDCGLYRVEVDNGGGVLYSEVATLDGIVKVISHPKDIYVFNGKQVQFEIQLDSSDGITYQWQYSTDGVNWNNCNNATSNALTFTMSPELDGNMYRCKYSTVTSDNYSNVATLHYAQDVKITSQYPKTDDYLEIPVYSIVEFKVTATGYIPQYRWQRCSIFGGDWEYLDGETSNVLRLKITDSSICDYYFRCEVFNDNSTAFSSEACIGYVDMEIIPYNKWTFDNNLTISESAPNAILHNDGITNLEKFAFGLDATKATSYSENVNFKQTNNGTTTTFQFSLNKNVSLVGKTRSVSDVSAKVLVSEDLVNWTEASATANGETANGQLNLYKVEMPIPEGGKLFFKVEASQNN